MGRGESGDDMEDKEKGRGIITLMRRRKRQRAVGACGVATARERERWKRGKETLFLHVSMQMRGPY